MFCYPSPALFGMATNASSGRPSEIAAVSTHLLLGLGEHADPSIQRFRKITPFNRVGKSIWLCHIGPAPGQHSPFIFQSPNDRPETGRAAHAARYGIPSRYGLA